MPESKRTDPATGLHLDDSGQIALNPMTGWIAASGIGMNAVLAIEYLSSPEELRTASRSQIQFVLTPQQCLEVSVTLTKLANKILENSAKDNGPAN
jgi:hypothetical protein